MLGSEHYSDQMSEDDALLGFVVKDIQPSIIMTQLTKQTSTRAIVLTMGLNDRIVKIAGPSLIYYVHDHKLPTGSWITIPSISITPQQAIERLDVRERWMELGSDLPKVSVP